ncbi:hypothetical protein KW794_01875 [Candidatus Saccharibacteria bacterium]|nr:hypothetical protein [Candidatus Saccharibacteria bacterium]
MNRYLAFGLMVIATVAVVGGGVLLAGKVSATSTNTPTLSMAGNGGVCSLSTTPHNKHTFKIKLAGWKPNSSVQIRVFQADASDYGFPLKNGGVVRVDGDGSHTGPPWPCWPNKTCETCGVSDKKEGYIVLAAQQGVKSSSRPVYATATFLVVK